MTDKERFISSLYKPFRNQIRQYNLLESLKVIWSYARNYTFDLPFPSEVETNYKFNPNAPLSERKHWGIYEFEQEYFLKEFIINCDRGGTKHSLFKIDRFAKLINYIRRDFKDKIDSKYPVENFTLEFNRMAHNQFVWQQVDDQTTIVRYFKLYSYNDVNEIIKNKFTLPIHELSVIGYLLYYHTGRVFRTKLPYVLDFKFVNNDMVKIYFDHFSIDMEDVRNELSKYQQMNENIFYSYNPLLAKPILIYENSFLLDNFLRQ